jgi:hypothetical protein
MVYFFKIALKSRKAPAGKVGKMLQVAIILVVLIHISLKIYFAGFVEIKQKILQFRISAQKNKYSFLNFNFYQFAPICWLCSR